LTSVTFLGDAPTDNVTVFYNNTDLTSVTRSSTATGWDDSWGGVDVVIADPQTLSADGFNYTLTGSDATVTGCTSTCSTTLVIPSTLAGYSVTSIGEDAFYSNFMTAEGDKLTTVTIPNSVTSIGASAFNGNLLTTVSIPNSVTSIGGYAFSENLLTSVTFLGNAPTDGGDGFSGNIGLTSVKRPYAKATGWGSTWSGVAVVIADARATATVNPSMSGTLAVGKTLTAAPGTWTGYPTPTFAYQWYACTRAVTVARSTVPSTCVRISRATRSTFKITSAQRGKFIAVFVTGTSAGTASMSWLSTTSVDARATATVKPTIKGTATVGKTLTGSKGTWKGYPTPTFTYQWYACTRAVTVARSTVPSTCVRISGATRSTFTLTTAQRGKYVAVLVTGASLRTTATAWLSKTTTKVR
jgi:hypothetical protein